MEAKVTWNGRMSFSGLADSGFEVPLDTHAAVGGDENGLRPMELFAIGLAGCTAMDVISILKKMRQPVSAFEVSAHIQRAEEHPKVFTAAVLEYRVAGDGLDETSVLRAIELSAVRYCPAQAMFNEVFPIRLVYKIYSPGADGQERLVSEGEFIPAEAGV